MESLCARVLKERSFKRHLSGEKNLEYFVGRPSQAGPGWRDDVARAESGQQRRPGPSASVPGHCPGLSPEPGSGPQTPAPASAKPQAPPVIAKPVSRDCVVTTGGS